MTPIPCPHKIKHNKQAYEGAPCLFPEYDDITGEILMKEGELARDGDLWYFPNAHPDFVEYDEEFWAQVELL